MRRYAASLLFVCGTSVLAATQAARQPKSWQLADEERIIRRTATAQTHGYKEGIDGRVHPELFMPYELFDHLLLGLSSDARLARHARARLDAKIRAFGYDETTFWKTLSTTALPYLSAREEHKKQHQGASLFRLPDGRKSMVPIDRDDCAARIEALRNTRQQLGGDELDRFLYSKIASDFQHSEGGNAPDRAAQLRYMAKGCQ